MKFYQEITLIDQAEISPYFIWSKLYTQLHIALAKSKDTNDKVNIGVSFPQYIFEEKIEGKKPKSTWVKSYGFLLRMKLI